MNSLIFTFSIEKIKLYSQFLEIPNVNSFSKISYVTLRIEIEFDFPIAKINNLGHEHYCFQIF
jgi:hypothetical protein